MVHGPNSQSKPRLTIFSLLLTLLSCSCKEQALYTLLRLHGDQA